MMSLVLIQTNHTLAVTIDINMLLINSQIIYQIMKPKIASLKVSVTTIYSVSVVDKATIDYKVYRQHTIPSVIVNT